MLGLNLRNHGKNVEETEGLENIAEGAGKIVFVVLGQGILRIAGRLG